MPGRELALDSVARQCVPLDELAAASDLHPDFVQNIVAYGLLEPVRAEQTLLWFDVTAVRRLRTIRRLRDDLGINLAGIAVVLDLLERIEALERELAHLRR